MLTVEESVKLFLTKYSDTLKDDQIKKGIRTTGNSARSLQIRVTKTGGTLSGSGYFVFQQEGRRPGALPPIEAIQRWILLKHLKLNAWAVAKSIAKKGTRAFRQPSHRLNIDAQAEIYKRELLENLGNAYSALIIKELKDFTTTI